MQQTNVWVRPQDSLNDKYYPWTYMYCNNVVAGIGHFSLVLIFSFMDKYNAPNLESKFFASNSSL